MRSSMGWHDIARLERIRETVQTFLSQRFSAYEYTVPRLFVVLPDSSADDRYARRNSVPIAGLTEAAPREFSSACRYRLYFLCECGTDFTLPLGSGLNHLHIAKHPGYEIEPGRQDEFFRRYGAMILTLLIFLKHGYDPVMDSSASSQVSSMDPQDHHELQQQQQQHQQKLQRQQLSDDTRMHLSRVEKISNLKRSDLPDSISQYVEQRVNRMIEFLERIRGQFNQNSEGAEEIIEEDRLLGISSLADLHLLYSFLGITDVNRRHQSGQLGNLYRVNDITGRVSWVCVYHYRWTFLEKNLDEFEHWVITRCGQFDKQSGSLSITLVSRAHARTFCSWITNKVASSLVEVHLKLGWKFGKKDLWRIVKALANTTVSVLSLDGCSYGEDSTYKILQKKYDPILHLLIHGRLRSLELMRLPSLFARLSQKTIKAPTLRRLEFGHGMAIEPNDRGSFNRLLASCSSLRELILPGFRVSDTLMQAILSGIRVNNSLATLDLSNSQLDGGAAIILAQGLFNTRICHLDLSRNERLSDAGAARVIRAVGPRLVSLKMAQTGFGDLAAAALAKSMDGISFTNTLRDQLQLQYRLDIAALTAGIRVRTDDLRPSNSGKSQMEAREKTHSTGHLVYLDIEDNQCTLQGFQELAKVKSRLYLVYLNMAGSSELEDEECARILNRVMSSEMITLRLACTRFGDQSARALATTLLERPPRVDDGMKRISGPCQLEELDVQACPIGAEGFLTLYNALRQAQAWSCLKVLDFGHCSKLQDSVAQQFLKLLVIPNATERTPVMPIRRWRSQAIPSSQSLSAIAAIAAQKSSTVGLDDLREAQSDSGRNARVNSLVGMRRGVRRGVGPRSKSILVRADSVPVMPTLRSFYGDQGTSTTSSPEPTGPLLPPPTAQLPLAEGFFSNLSQLDLKSTQIGDGTAWLLAQALVQPWVTIGSLTLLEPQSMSVQGMCWIVNALCDNSTVQEFGIGKSGVHAQADLDHFGATLLNLMETNKRVRSLTTLGAPLGPVAKGLLLNQSLHSIYLIQSRGHIEDLQLMGQALAFNRSLLVFWMGGTDESLLGVPHPTTDEYSSHGPEDRLDNTILADQEQQSQGQPENMYRNFHLMHQHHHHHHHHPHKSHLHHKQKRKVHDAHRFQLSHHYGQSMSQKIRSILKTTFSPSSKDESSKRRHDIASEDHRSRIVTSPVSRRNSFGAQPMETRAVNRAGTAATVATVTASSLWGRNPIMEGIRRNHSLIKVTLDAMTPAPLVTNATSNQINNAPEGMGPSTNSTWTTHSSNAATEHFRYEQVYMMQKQLLNKKVQANRKLLRERGKLGWEELKLLGVDDDVIREVCQAY
ncbi:hypothetical protein BG011_004505 [Mortierella polycephala]|uniref:RNI-like protein n=1 Tax=Mortierella polycephala TaxID=41804 RepID=A0A9P6PY07_9FUNG|nr:hypothetical protein BG011_004505 [Mortierella polycephala]